MAANNQDTPDAHCLPLGNLQLHTHPQPRTYTVLAGEFKLGFGRAFDP